MPVNYLDDFLFIALLKALCDGQIRVFIQICNDINFPISQEKTFWSSTKMTFLGFLIDSVKQLVIIPASKLAKGRNMIEYVLEKKKGKLMLMQLQKICGFLNFLSRAIIPGRTFTRHLYAKLDPKLKEHHHIRIDAEMRKDLQMWLEFLKHRSSFVRPFMDFTKMLMASEIDFYSDASKNPKLGFGAKCDKAWLFRQWDFEFMKKHDPSIAYLELFTLTAAVLSWVSKFSNKRIIIFCNNQAVVQMINTTTSSCKHCMILLRVIVLYSMIHNVRIYAKYIRSADNEVSDTLSRLNWKKFAKLKEWMHLDEMPTPIPDIIWPMTKVWSYC